MKPLNIFLVDDDELARSGLELVISREPDMCVIETAANGAEALQKLEHHRPDLILLDIQMPELNGIETIRRIRAVDSVTPILILTRFDETEYITAGLKYGANGYLLKGIALHKLIQNIRDVISSEFILPTAIALKLTHFALEQQRILEQQAHQFDFSLEGFTKKEREIVPLFYARLSVEEIAEQCFISVGTLRNHLRAIYEKLQVTNRADALKAISRLPKQNE